jgi:hypothetical protein
MFPREFPVGRQWEQAVAIRISYDVNLYACSVRTDKVFCIIGKYEETPVGITDPSDNIFRD